MKKTLTVFLAIVLVVVIAVAGTVAWLTDTTAPKVNTFTIGNIDIGLTETEAEYKMIPGSTLSKDPTVTVAGGSEACWLFVKVEESTNLDDFITYAMADGWTALPQNAGVYYRQVSADAADQTFAVLANNQVTVKDTVTKAMMDGLAADDTLPTLTFTAYAVQHPEFEDDVAGAWDEVKPAA